MDDAYLVMMGTRYEPGLRSLGMDMLREPLRLAAQALISTYTPSYRAESLAQAVAFVRGSGLELVIETFGLSLDPEDLRNTFFSWTLRERKRQSSASLFHTTRNGSSTAA